MNGIHDIFDTTHLTVPIPLRSWEKMGYHDNSVSTISLADSTMRHSGSYINQQHCPGAFHEWVLETIPTGRLTIGFPRQP